MKQPSFKAMEGRLPEAGVDYDHDADACEDEYNYLAGYGQYSDYVQYFVQDDPRTGKVLIIGTKEGNSIGAVKAKYADLAPLLAMGPQAIETIRSILEYQGSILDFFGPDHPVYEAIKKAHIVIDILDHKEEE